jgi:4-amino-4-deoxy-L-arabinose transferase-like glycosyltransferase
MVEVAPPPAPSRLRVQVLTARVVEAAAVLGLLAVALWLRVPNLDAYTGSFDEGIRAQQLLLMSAGYRPFRDIFASQGPLLLDLLYPFYLAFGQTLTAARAGVVVCSVVALIGAAWTARQIAGPIAGLAALLILAVSPTFLDGSRLALAEVPTQAPSLLALGCVLAYRRTGNRWLLALGAACCALALLIKPMALHLGAPIAVLLLVPPLGDEAALRSWDGRSWYGRRWLADVLGFGLLVLAICVVVILALGPAQVWDNLGAYRGGVGHGLGADAVPNVRLTFNIMRQEQIGLYVLALVGAVLGLWRRPVPTLALLAWAAAVLAMFALYGDLADKHIVYLLPAVALLAAIGAGLGFDAIVAVVRSAQDRERPSWRPGRAASIAAGLGAAGIVAYLASLPTVYVVDQYQLRVAPKIAAERRGRAVDLEIAGIIRDRTSADGWVLADNPLAAYIARRKVLPYLVDTSGTRIDAGSLTAALAIDQIQRYQPSVIVTWPRRLGKLDELTRRLPELGYRLERSYELGWKVYVRE